MTGQFNESIFIIDDDTDDQELFTLALQQAGFHGPVTGFGNGAKLLDHLNSNPATLPSLLILDLNMPVKSGIDTLREIKSKDELRHIPVMVLTSSPRKLDEETCWELGCDYYYNKPMNYHAYNDLAVSAIKYAGGASLTS